MRITKIVLLVAVMLVSLSCNKQTFKINDRSQGFQQVQAYNNKVDVLVMVDNSSSMDKYQTKLANQIPSMIAKLNQMGMDYNISVVSSDMSPGGSGGKFLGSPAIITSKMGNAAALLSSRVQMGSGASSLELGLQSIREAFTKDAKSFLRQDALLVLIFLTDGDDYTAGGGTDFINFINQYKTPFASGAKSWIANFVGQLALNGTCPVNEGEVGLEFFPIVDYTGGLKQSICDATLAAAVQNIQVQILQFLTDYYLKGKPVAGSIRVTLNGQVVPNSSANGWTYSAEKNMVRFHGTAIPAVHDDIQVTFTPVDAS